MTLSQCRQMAGGGCADVACAGAALHGVISYATLLAAVIGWDLRAPGIYGSLSHPTRYIYLSVAPYPVGISSYLLTYPVYLAICLILRLTTIG